MKTILELREEAIKEDKNPEFYLYQKLEEITNKLQRKDNNWNELKEWLNEPQITYNLDASEFGIEKIECVSIKDILDKMKELENGNK